jgi:hypothetical protein
MKKLMAVAVVLACFAAFYFAVVFMFNELKDQTPNKSLLTFYHFGG